MAKNRPDAERRARQAERLARILRVLQIILRPGQWNAETIARELECSERTVFRDLQTLSMAEVPWYFDEEAQSYRVRPGFRFRGLEPGRQAESHVHVALKLNQETPLQLTNASLEVAQRLMTDVQELTTILVRLRTMLDSDEHQRTV